MVPPYFDRSVNPVSTGGTYCAHHITTGPPDFQIYLVPLGHIKTAGSEKAGENFVFQKHKQKRDQHGSGPKEGLKITREGTIYSATSFLGKCRKVVREIWFEKSSSRKMVDLKKKVILYHKSKKILVREKWLTRKKNPSLKNHFSTLFQKRGCRIDGPL